MQARNSWVGVGRGARVSDVSGARWRVGLGSTGEGYFCLFILNNFTIKLIWSLI
jgi:hypothetical protein